MTRSWTRLLPLFLSLSTVPCYGWNVDLQYFHFSNPNVVAPCATLTATIVGDGGVEPFTLALVPFLNSSLKVMEYTFPNRSAPVSILVPYPAGSTIIPIVRPYFSFTVRTFNFLQARDASGAAAVSNSLQVFDNSTSFAETCVPEIQPTDFSFTMTPLNPTIGEPARLAWNAADTLG
jgi:hypothetical protein